MKEKALILSRQNHIKHINRSMPLIAILFLIQNMVMSYAYPKESFGDYTIFCAITICSYVAILFWYDKTIYTRIFKDRLETTTLFGSNKTIYFKDITKVIAPQKELPFSTIILCSQDQIIPLRYIDSPVATKEFILKLINESKIESNDIAA
ncbi:MAG: hypothetical protein N4A33_04520 [Bacteriovoracaceae bacterium]|jgi:hypothetical protein|nr:hypothetical protein [Bacteriovoracaceae bacterium]